MPFSLTPTLESAIAALADALAAAGVAWVISGSTARALHGFSVVPNDLDIEVEEGATHRAALALGLSEHHDHDPRVSSHRAQGIWRDVEIDISGGLEFHGPGGNLHPDFALLRMFATPVTVDGRLVHLAPVEEQIARNVVLANEARLDQIADERPTGFAVNEVYLSLRLAAASAAW